MIIRGDLAVNGSLMYLLGDVIKWGCHLVVSWWTEWSRWWYFLGGEIGNRESEREMYGCIGN